jgi:two-component system sensor histidine kinase UhpB
LGRENSLAGQVVAANVVLVTLTLFGASLAAGLDISIAEQRWQFAVLALAVVLTLCVNLWMLKRRFSPLDNLIDRVERVDPSQPSSLTLQDESVAEIDRLARSFKRLLQRIEAERTRAGRLVLRAQEEERRRLARDLHDEVNQALTAILLRLEALAQEEPGRAHGASPHPASHGPRRPRAGARPARPAQGVLSQHGGRHPILPARRHVPAG